MLNKKIMMLAIFLVSLLAVSAVSAADNATSDLVSVEETTVDVVKETTDEVVSVEKDQVILGNESNFGTFDDLSSLIENTTEGTTLELEKDYKYVNGSTGGIQINKAITIDGKGHAIDGNSLSKIFRIINGDATLKNITFINAFADYQGGAIYCFGETINIDSCSFVNCSGLRSYGECNGVAIYFYNLKNFNISNSIFVNNVIHKKYKDTIEYSNGCVYVEKCNKGIFENCTFTNNSVPFFGGAICFWMSGDIYINNCNFTNNSVVTPGNGGAIYIYLTNSTLSNCIFTDNRAYVGHSIYGAINSDDPSLAVYNYAIIYNCYFTPENVTHNILYSEGNLTFIKRDATLNASSISFNYGCICELPVVLKHKNSFLANYNIIFNLTNNNISKIFAKKSNATGGASLNDELNELNVGTWNVTVIFKGNDNYYPCNVTATITVLPPGTSLTIDDVNTVVGHDVNLIAKIVDSNKLPINEGIVAFYDSENYIGEGIVKKGTSTLKYVPKTAGEHKITAVFKSENYGSSNDSAVLSVAKANVNLAINNIGSVYFSMPSKFVVNVNSNSRGINEGEIKFYVNDILVGTSNVYNGEAKFNYVAKTAGSFTLTVVYNETENYLASNTTGSFKVNKMPTTLTGESIIFDEEDYKTFTTTLKDNNNNGVGDQPVKIEVIKYSGESATFNGVSDANGITIYDVGRLAGGMWYVTGIYAGNNNYINSRFVDKFIVVRMNTTTEIEEIDNPKVNHNYKLKANIHDENGKLVKEGIVQFYLDGVDIGSIDLSKNQGHQDALSEGVLGAVNPMFEFVVGADDVSDLYINYVPTKAGKHTLTAVYEGTTIYKASNSTTSFDVSNSNTVETSIVASDVSTVYNGGKYLVIQLKDVNGKAVNGVKVTVVLGGKTYTPSIKNGQAKVSTNGFAPVKTYKATITFKGNSKYDKSTTTAKVVVKKATPKLTAKAKTFKKSVKTKKYTVTLKTNQNKVMKNTKVTLKVNGKTYSAKTNAKGQATFKITKLTKKGKFTAVVKYAGNKYYNAKTVKPKIIVK